MNNGTKIMHGTFSVGWLTNILSAKYDKTTAAFLQCCSCFTAAFLQCCTCWQIIRSDNLDTAIS